MARNVNSTSRTHLKNREVYDCDLIISKFKEVGSSKTAIDDEGNPYKQTIPYSFHKFINTIHVQSAPAYNLTIESVITLCDWLDISLIEMLAPLINKSKSYETEVRENLNAIESTMRLLENIRVNLEETLP